MNAIRNSTYTTEDEDHGELALIGVPPCLDGREAGRPDLYCDGSLVRKSIQRAFEMYDAFYSNQQGLTQQGVLPILAG